MTARWFFSRVGDVIEFGLQPRNDPTKATKPPFGRKFSLSSQSPECGTCHVSP
jgi:hypothetical protein